MTESMDRRGQAEEIVSRAVRAALDCGADEAAAILRQGRSALSRFAMNRMTQNLERQSADLTIAVAVGKRECTLSGAYTDDDALRRMAAKCVENARIFEENAEHQPPVGPTEYRRVVAYDPEVAALEPEVKAETISEICCQAGARGLSAFGTFRNDDKVMAVANSSGLLASHASTDVAFSMTARTQDNTGSGREERWETWLRNLDPREYARTAIERAEMSRCPREPPPDDYTVILTPRAAADYLAFVFWSLDARMAETGRSPLARHNGNGALVGEKLFSDCVTIRSVVDDPDNPAAPFGPAFSFEGSAGQGSTMTAFSHGLPVEAETIVEQGVLRKLFYSYTWARQRGVRPLGFPNVIRMEGEDRDIWRLVADTERGILISSFWYIRFVDANSLLLTGLTRDGTFYIEDGQIKYPIKNLRFNESPLVSLKNIDGLSRMGKSRSWGFTLLMPGMRIRDFTFSSTSDAI